MRNFMAEVDQVGRSRGDGAGCLEGLIEIHVCRMRRLAEGVQHQHLDSVSRLHRLDGNRRAVGVVSKQLATSAVEDVAGGGESAMRQIDGNNGGLPELKRTIEDLGG